MWPVPIFACELGPVRGSHLVLGMWRSFPPPLESVLGPSSPSAAPPVSPPAGAHLPPTVDVAAPPPASTRPAAAAAPARAAAGKSFGHAIRAQQPATCRYPGCLEPGRGTGFCSERCEELWFDRARDAEDES